MVRRVCELCKKDIEAEEAFMNMPEDKFAHEKCFSLGSCPVCGKDLRVVEDLVGANGKKYHLDCFKCAKCQCKLESYVVKDENLLCKPCAVASQTSSLQPKGTCAACEKPVEGNQKAFAMEDKMYHAECFVCAQCSGDLTGGCTYFEDKLCCKACFTKMKEKIMEEKRNQLHEQQAQQKEAPRTAVICVECKKPITSQALQALGRTWHVECIKCFRCHNVMSGKLFPVNNEPHCQTCVETLKQEDIERQRQEHSRQQQQHQSAEDARRAEHEKAEKEKEEVALSKSLDEKAKIQSSQSSVQCHVCHADIKGAYQELGGIIHCNNCAEVVQKAIVCDKCRKVVEPGVEFRRTLGKFYHADCFCCVECKTPLQGNEYKVHEGKVYCEKHYAEFIRQFKENCSLCNKPITEGEVVVENDKGYHAACFTCHTCKKRLGDGKFVPSEGKFFCRECFVGEELSQANKGGIIKMD